jgi:hypothetical protein
MTILSIRPVPDSVVIKTGGDQNLSAKAVSKPLSLNPAGVPGPQGPQGAAGPQGPAGPVGPAGGSPLTTTFSGLAAGQSIALDAEAGVFTLLVINGLVESPQNYSVSGSTLIVPPGLVWDGAVCLFYYTPAPTS